MAKTAERSERESPSPKDVGRHLREVRKQQGLSRGVVARSAGLTRRELAAYERGRVEVPESDLWCLAGSCGVEVSELLPRRDPLQISPDLTSLGVGDTIRHLREPGQPDGLVRQYLSMIYELRNLPPGSRVPLRQPDLAALADALGGTPESIEARLTELIGASPDEAARLRAMVLPPLPLPTVAPAPASAHTPGDPYAALANDDVPPEVEQFFAGPGPADPFAAPGTAAPTPAPIGFNAPAEAAPAAAMPSPPMTAPPEAPMPFAAPSEPTPPGPAMAPAAYASPPAAPTAPPAFGAPPPATPFPAADAAPVFAPPPTAPVPPPAAPDAVFAPPAPTAPLAEPTSQPTPLIAPPPLPATPFPPTADAGPMAPGPVPAVLDALRPPPPPPPAPNGNAPVADPLAGVPATGSDPFAGPVDPQATAAAQLRDPFAAPSAIDPLAPPPLPPDPFAVPAAAAAPPNGNDAIDHAATAAAEAGVVFDDPFAPPQPSVPDAAALDAGLGITVLDAIVVDDPMADRPGPAAPPAVDHPAPASRDAVDVLAPGPSVAPPVEPPEAAITWNATVGPAPEPAPAPAPTRPAPPASDTPRFERASTQWQIGGIFPATAMADDGTLALRRADTRWALTDLSAPGDCIVEAAVDFRAGSGFGLIFRGSIDQSERITGYSFDVDPIAGGGGYLVRLWEAGKQHWRPLAQAPVTDPALLYGRHAVHLTLRADQLTVLVDGDPVLEIPALSRCTVELGREPARGDRVGVQAWSTTEVTIESFRVANL